LYSLDWTMHHQIIISLHLIQSDIQMILHIVFLIYRLIVFMESH